LEPQRKRPKQPEFEAVLEKSIQEGLLHILGQSGMQMVLSKCPLGQISADPEAFHDFLEAIFMEQGALMIEREVAHRLLDALGSETKVEGSWRRSWLAIGTSHGKTSGRVSKDQKEVLRQFLALEALPMGHEKKGKAEALSIELTAASFAYAFRKGS
jgi:hypothetical protein